MNPLSWDPNAYYQRLLLRHVPAGTRRVLDVGCGAGALAVRLASCEAAWLRSHCHVRTYHASYSSSCSRQRVSESSVSPSQR